jgi:hypothetical protein
MLTLLRFGVSACTGSMGSKSLKRPSACTSSSRSRAWQAHRGAGPQEECRGWDVNEAVFSAALWPVYQPLMRADFTLFDEYEFRAAGGARARPPCVWLLPDRHTRQVPGMPQRACQASPGALVGDSARSSPSLYVPVCTALLEDSQQRCSRAEPAEEGSKRARLRTSTDMHALHHPKALTVRCHGAIAASS